MTTVGYGDLYPQTHLGRFFAILSCLIGMLLVSYLVVGMSSYLDFTPQERQAYTRIKKLSSNLRDKAANVIRTAIRLKKGHYKFVQYLLLKRQIGLLRNQGKVAHSHMMGSEQMIKGL